MNQFRAPFFWLGYLAFVLAVMVELGSSALLPPLPVPTGGTDAGAAVAAAAAASTPGWAIRALALVDAVALFGVTLIGIAWTPRISGFAARGQGVAAVIFSLFGCLGAAALAYAALALLTLMVTLLLAVPFGTIAYLIRWKQFPVEAAETTLALVMFLKLVFCVLLVLAHQDFLKNRGLVISLALSVGATWATAFAIGFVPSFLASVADVAAALVLAVVAIAWMVVLLVGSLFQIAALLRGATA